jgi:hypothetical protein
MPNLKSPAKKPLKQAAAPAAPQIPSAEAQAKRLSRTLEATVAHCKRVCALMHRQASFRPLSEVEAAAGLDVGDLQAIYDFSRAYVVAMDEDADIPDFPG